jgi:uncharacterized repeat protein (TIGR01451 family)
MKVKNSRGIEVECCTASLVSAAKATLSQKLRIRNVGFALLCCAVLMFVAAPAWADQCSAPTVGSGTGVVGNANGSNTCGAVITVSAVDTNGKATAFTVTPTGNGNPYDGTEDTLVGIQNNSGQDLKSITLSSPDTTFGGLFGFDGDGPCTANQADCFNGASSGVDPGDYQGPDNTFSNISSTSCTVNNVLTTCHTSGTVDFTTAIPANGSTWFALEGTPQSLAAISQTQTVSTTQTSFQFQNDAYNYEAKLNSGSAVSVTVTPILMSQTACNALVQKLASFSGTNSASCFIYKDANGPGSDSPVLFEVTCSGGDCTSFDAELGTNFDLAASEPGFNTIAPFPGWLKGHGPDLAHPCTPSPDNNPPLFQSNQIDSFTLTRTDPKTTGGSGGSGSCWGATYNQPDEALPGITITSPMNGASYPQNQTVQASYSCNNPTTSNLPENTHPTGPYLTAASCTDNTSTPNSCGSSGTGLTCTNTVDTSTSGTHTFTVTALDSGENTATQSVTYTVVVAPPTDVAINKFAPSKIVTGSNLTYGIGVTDNGSVNAVGVNVTDTLPAGTSFVSASGSNVSCSTVKGKLVCSTTPISCTGTSTVTCNVGTLTPLSVSPKNAAVIQITVKVTAAGGTTIQNTATVSETNTDTNPSNNSSTASTRVTAH